MKKKNQKELIVLIKSLILRDEPNHAKKVRKIRKIIPQNQKKCLWLLDQTQIKLCDIIICKFI